MNRLIKTGFAAMMTACCATAWAADETITQIGRAHV